MSSSSHVDPVRFELYGPLRATRGGREVDLGAPVQRALITCLLLRADVVVSADDLVDAVWDRPPRTSAGLVRTYVSRARSGLGAGVLETSGGGYRVRSTAVRLDSAELVERAEQLRRDKARAEVGETTRKLRVLVESCSGLPLAGVPGPFAERRRDHLERTRLDAHEELLSAELGLGQYARVAADATMLLLDHPLREPLVALQVEALHAAGRTADALAAYHTARTLLAEELGTDPSDDLQRLYRSLLGRGGARGTPRERAPETGRTDLPGTATELVGRTGELSRLVAGKPGATALVDGMPGAGKTALAVHAARRLTTAFPDGQLFLDLRGHRAGARPLEPDQVLDVLIRTAGGTPPPAEAEIDERAASWRALCAWKRLVVVLDDASSPEQVLPLVGGGLSLTIVTSRRRLVEVPCAVAVSIGPLSREQGARLLAMASDQERVTADGAAAEAVSQMCGGLPLALTIAGARLRHRPSWTIRHLRDRLADERGRLRELRARTPDVRAAFELSTSSLDPHAAAALQVLGDLPVGDLGLEAMSVAVQLDVGASEEVLERLLDENLVTQTVPGRYGVHDLMRSYLRAAPLVEGASAVDRLVDHYLNRTLVATAAESPTRRPLEPVAPPSTEPARRPDREEAGTWLESELSVLVALIDHGLRTDKFAHAWQLTVALLAFVDRRGLGSVLGDRPARVLAAAHDVGDDRAVAHLSLWAGLSAAAAGQFEPADLHLERAVGLAQILLARATEPGVRAELDWLHGRGTVWHAAVVSARGRTAQAAEALSRLVSTTTDQSLLPLAWIELAQLQQQRGLLHEAVHAARESVAAARLAGDRRAEILGLRCLGEVLGTLGDTSAAQTLHEALGLASGFDERFAALTRSSLGRVRALEGDPCEADALFQRAGEVLGEDVLGSDAIALALRIADAHLFTGRFTDAADRYGSARAMSLSAGSAHEQAWAVAGLAHTARARGADEDAALLWDQAHEMLAALDVPDPVGLQVAMHSRRHVDS